MGLACMRYRNPSRCNADLRRRSGDVFFFRLADITERTAKDVAHDVRGTALTMDLVLGLAVNRLSKLSGHVFASRLALN
jgi:hypothetical protein